MREIPRDALENERRLWRARWIRMSDSRRQKAKTKIWETGQAFYEINFFSASLPRGLSESRERNNSHLMSCFICSLAPRFLQLLILQTRMSRVQVMKIEQLFRNRVCTFSKFNVHYSEETNFLFQTRYKVSCTFFIEKLVGNKGTLVVFIFDVSLVKSQGCHLKLVSTVLCHNL